MATFLHHRPRVLAMLTTTVLMMGVWTAPADAEQSLLDTPSALPAGSHGTVPYENGRSCAEVQRQLADLVWQGEKTTLCLGLATPDTGKAPDAAVEAVPEWCAYVYNRWTWNRFQQCLNLSSYVAMIDVITGAEIGRTYFYLQHVTTAKWDQLSFTDDFTITRGESEGVMENDDDMTVEFEADCLYGCSGGADSGLNTWDYGESVHLFYTYYSTVGDGLIQNSRLGYEIWFDHEDAVGDGDTPLTYEIGDVRCDRVSYRAYSGCVTGFHTPTLGQAGLGAVTNHIINAHALGHPGAPGISTLMWDDSDTNADMRRAASCGGFTPLPGESCDEYPFAHTWQGGSGASVASVPLGDNSSQGGKISTFVQYQRVLTGERFYVDPYVSEPY